MSCKLKQTLEALDRKLEEAQAGIEALQDIVNECKTESKEIIKVLKEIKK